MRSAQPHPHPANRARPTSASPSLYSTAPEAIAGPAVRGAPHATQQRPIQYGGAARQQFQGVPGFGRPATAQSVFPGYHAPGFVIDRKKAKAARQLPKPPDTVVVMHSSDRVETAAAQEHPSGVSAEQGMAKRPSVSSEQVPPTHIPDRRENPRARTPYYPPGFTIQQGPQHLGARGLQQQYQLQPQQQAPQQPQHPQMLAQGQRQPSSQSLHDQSPRSPNRSPEGRYHSNVVRRPSAANSAMYRSTRSQPDLSHRPANARWSHAQVYQQQYHRYLLELQRQAGRTPVYGPYSPLRKEMAAHMGAPKSPMQRPHSAPHPLQSHLQMQQDAHHLRQKQQQQALVYAKQQQQMRQQAQLQPRQQQAHMQHYQQQQLKPQQMPQRHGQPQLAPHQLQQPQYPMSFQKFPGPGRHLGR